METKEALIAQAIAHVTTARVYLFEAGATADARRNQALADAMRFLIRTLSKVEQAQEAPE